MGKRGLREPGVSAKGREVRAGRPDRLPRFIEVLARGRRGVTLTYDQNLAEADLPGSVPAVIRTPA